MTALLILSFIAALALIAPVVGADSREHLVDDAWERDALWSRARDHR